MADVDIRDIEKRLNVRARLVATQGPQGDEGPTGATGSPGEDGATGSTGAAGADGKTMLSGAGAPSGGLGGDGDFYMDTTAHLLYGPKTAGNWGAPFSVVGPTGATGSQGIQGIQGVQGDPGADATIKSAEIDLGETPVGQATMTVTDGDVTTGSHIMAQIAWEAPTGKDIDEIEMDDIQLRCKPATGSFDVYVHAADGSYLADKFKIYYIIG